MNPGAWRAAGLARRLGASAYEALLIAAVLILVGFALLPVVSPTPAATPPGAPPSIPQGVARPLYLLSPGARLLSATVTFAVCGLYCSVLWSGGRRTLAMKTWRLVLSTASGSRVDLPGALLRYLSWWAGPVLAIGTYLLLEPPGYGRWALAVLAFNYVWALIDRDRQFFQDRAAGTRLTVDTGSIS